MRKTITALALSAAMLIGSVGSVMASSTDPTVPTPGGSHGIGGDGTMANVVLNVEVPTMLDFTINPFRMGMQATDIGQITNTPFPVVNHTPLLNVATVFYLYANVADNVEIVPPATAAVAGWASDWNINTRQVALVLQSATDITGTAPAFAAFNGNAQTAFGDRAAGPVSATAPLSQSQIGFALAPAAEDGFRDATVADCIGSTCPETDACDYWYSQNGGPAGPPYTIDDCLSQNCAATSACPWYDTDTNGATGNITVSAGPIADGTAYFMLNAYMRTFAPWQDGDINLEGVLWLTPLHPDTVNFSNAAHADPNGHRMVLNSHLPTNRQAIVQVSQGFPINTGGATTAPGFTRVSTTEANLNVGLTTGAIFIPFIDAAGAVVRNSSGGAITTADWTIGATGITFNVSRSNTIRGMAGDYYTITVNGVVHTINFV